MAIYNHSKEFVASLTANHRNALRVLITTELKQLRHELQMSNVAVMSEEDRKIAAQTPEPEEPRQVMEAEADYSTGYDDVQSLG